MSSLEPTPEQFAALAARPADAPVVMINLLQFRADVGRESYLRYAKEVAPHLQRVGGTVRYAGAAPGVVIGDGEKPWWDAIIVVEYPSPAAFLEHGVQRGVPQGARVPRCGTGPRRPDRHVDLVDGRLTPCT